MSGGNLEGVFLRQLDQRSSVRWCAPARGPVDSQKAKPN
jgi:hypothetical protein